MSIDKIVAKQYRDRVNQAVSQFGDVAIQPNHGLPVVVYAFWHIYYLFHCR